MLENSQLVYLPSVRILIKLFSFTFFVFLFVTRWPWKAPLGDWAIQVFIYYVLLISQYLSWITTGTGVLFANAFYIGTEELKNRVRTSSTYMDLGVRKERLKLSMPSILSKVPF